MVHITRHAIERYQQRVEPVSESIAREALTAPAVRAAARMGCNCKVLRPDGWRIVVKNGSVVTVEPTQNQRPPISKMKRMARNAKKTGVRERKQNG